MKKHIVTSLLVNIFLLLSVTASFAQGQPGKEYDTVNIHSDSDAINFTSQGDTVLQQFTFSLSYDSLDAFKAARDFRYIKYLDSLLKQEQLSVDTAGRKNLINRPGHVAETADTFFNSPFFKIFFSILAAGFIGFIIYKLFLTESLFKRGQPKIGASHQDDESIIAPAVFEVLIYDAVINANYPLAIRYLYFQTLQKLAEKGLIKLSPDKTNNEYVKELSGNLHQKEFAGITLTYEYAWYGKFAIDLDSFNKIQNSFKKYYQRL